MSKKQTYRCSNSANGRLFWCGKEKASASCLNMPIVGRCQYLGISRKAIIKKPVRKEEPRIPEKPSRKRRQDITTEHTSFEKALDVIKSTPLVPQPKEKGYEAQLYQALHSSGLPVEYESLRRGARFDLVLGRDEIAVELKIVKNTGIFDPLYGQIDRYHDQFNKIVIVLVDQFKNPSVMTKEIERLKKISPGNIEVLVK